MPEHETVTTQIGGKQRTGWFYVDRGMITVGNLHGQKTTQVGGSLPESLARVMLGELKWSDD